MSNGVRHVIGVLIGLILTPVIGLGVIYGTERVGAVRLVLGSGGGDRWLGAGVLAAVVVLVALLVGSRTSPLASLVPGLVYTANAAAWLAAPRGTIEHTVLQLPGSLGRLSPAVGSYELILGTLGGVLLVASLFPARWRARSPRQATPRATPQTPSGGHVRPYPAGQAPLPYGSAAAVANPPLPAGPHPPVSAPGFPGAAGLPGTGQPQQPPAAGEWTRMYGGDEISEAKARGVPEPPDPRQG